MFVQASVGDRLFLFFLHVWMGLYTIPHSNNHQFLWNSLPHRLDSLLFSFK